MLLYIVDIMVCSLMVNEIEDKYRFKIIECLQSLIFPGITFYEFQSIFIRIVVNSKITTQKIFSQRIFIFFFFRVSLQLYFNER